MMTAHPSIRIDTDYAYGLTARMAPHHRQVLAGSEAEYELAEFLRATLEELGIRCDVHEFSGLISHPGAGSLAILGADGEPQEQIACQVFAQSEPVDGLDASVVYLSGGGADDYEGVDVAGKIVLVNLSYSPPRPEKARIARDRGAAGMIMANWGADSDESIPFGTVKSLWGNPTRATIGDMRTLPAIGVSRPDGTRLIDLATSQQGLRVRLTAEVDRRWRRMLMPVAWVGEGPESGRPFVMAGGHFDNWGAGVTDNLAGNAAMVAMAKSLHERRDELVRDVVFPFWTGHETGIMIGSTWFVDRFWDQLRDRCVAYFSVAQLGLSGYSLWTAHAAGELHELVRTVEAPERFVIDRPEKTGDQSFYGLGIPAMDARTGPTDEERRASHGGILGWWYHSDNDTIDKLARTTYAGDVQRIGSYVNAIAASAVLPFSIADAAEELRSRLAAIVVPLGGSDAAHERFGLAGLLATAAELVREAASFDEWLAGVRERGDAREVDAANAAIRAFSRVTVPVRYSAASRYEQDTYGQSRLAFSLPELDVFRALAAEESEEQRMLMEAEALRARNRLSDALHDALATLRGPSRG